MLTAKEVLHESSLRTSHTEIARPVTLPRDGAVQLELEEGVLIFRVSEAVQNHIETLLHKQRSAFLSVDEAEELQQYEDVDDYLSFVNRLVRNLSRQ